ncbi:quinoprotein dehydrogenase-associated SoxYZ-like carrier [Emcibacter sp.]|uniref:quinoprotein dehydrogenase-associated SoxYZ-like carrier n=1 Tax=Emcibacter sp. TaxID=1979954 RepID=UPI003A8CCE73
MQTSFAVAEEPESPAWDFIRDRLFTEEREILRDETLTLFTPKRAENAAVVPVRIQANLEQSEKLFIKKIYLIVDNNPSPVAGVFTMSKLNGLASLSTRIRVNAYSHVRAIAETSDGKLHMAVNYVKASGGCSAPAAGGDEEALKRRGKMKLREKRQANLTEMQLMISHPNNSGLQIDQLSRNWIPADYVSDIKISLGGQEVLLFTGGISMSENPSFGFFLKSGEAGDLQAEVKDSQGRHFSQSWSVPLK